MAHTDGPHRQIATAESPDEPVQSHRNRARHVEDNSGGKEYDHQRRSLKISNASSINPTNRRRETRRAGLANMSDRVGDVVDFEEECDVDATSEAADGGEAFLLSPVGAVE